MEPLGPPRDDTPRIDVVFPLALDGGGRVTSSDYPEHVEEMIEQLLFTSPGQRVNRPDFGCGLLETVFAAASQEQITAIEYLVQGALQRWLGQVLEPERVVVEVSRETTLTVTVRYVLRQDARTRTITFRPREAATWDI